MNERAPSGGDSTAGGALAAALLLALAAGAVACGDAASGRGIEAEPSWLRECSSDAECAIGRCVCAVCTEPCASDANACSGAPAGAACFALGSLARAAVCGEDGAPGLCLPVCSAADDCGPGFTCALGACVPEAVLLESGASESPAEAAAAAYAELFAGSWFPYALPEPEPVGESCSDPARCPTLEALLRSDTCFEVKRGCGLTYLNARPTLPLARHHYWYDAYGAPPVLAYDLWDGTVLGSASVACDAIELSCSTCGQPSTVYSPIGTTAVACADVPGALPAAPPPPAAVAGCACESDGAGGASVSLACFCSIYDCPSHAALATGCDADLPSARTIEGAARDACGQTWFSTASYGGQRYTFDPVSGELVGATAFSQGPVTAPCGTDQVSAGAARLCESSEPCWCEALSADPACASVSWFPGP